MGVSASKNESSSTVFNKSVNESLNTSFISIAQNSVSSVNPTQRINIVASAGDTVNVSGLQQTIIANIDSQKFVSSVTQTQLESILSSAVTAAVDDNQSVAQALTIGGTASANASDMNIVSENMSRIVNSYTYSQFMSDVSEILSEQTVTLDTSAGSTVNVSDISQYVKIEILTKHIADVLTKTYNSIVSETDTDAEKTTDQKTSSGISSTAIVFIILFILIGAIVAFVIYRKVMSDRRGGWVLNFYDV